MRITDGTTFGRGIAAGILLCLGTFARGAPIARMDIYDHADNQLLFVTFAYNASGKCTGRSVYASDSTFLRSTSFGGTAGTETDVDYDGNTIFTTTVKPPADGVTSFSTVDQFKQTQYGSPLSYKENDPGTFTVSQDNATLCRQEYVYDDDNELSRINVTDKNGALAGYALISHEDVPVRHNRMQPLSRPVQVSVNRRTMRLGFGLVAAGIVDCQLISPAGRKVLGVMRKRVGAGNHQFVFRDLPVSAGAYVMRITIDGKLSKNRMLVVQE